MRAMLPFIKASFSGRGSWEATPGGRVEGEGTAVSPAAVDAGHRARARRAFSNTRDASKAKIEWASAWVLRSRELWGRRFVEHGEPRWRRWCSRERGEVSWWRCPGDGESWRRDAPERGGGRSTSSLRAGELTRSVGVPWRRPLVVSLVSSPEPSSGGPPRLESLDPEREFGSDLKRSLPVSWASWLGPVEDHSLPE